MGEDKRKKEICVEALTYNLDQVNEFVESMIEDSGCSARTVMQVRISVEEIFVNIANYAYSPEIGKATIAVEVSDEQAMVTIMFMDSGTPYDPLAKADPDTTLSIEDREIGGMGILIVKKSMDAVNYEYKDGKNILTIKKKINSE